MPSLKLSNPFRRGADRPSLRERAAALRATAGRVLGETTPHTVGKASEVGPADANFVDRRGWFGDLLAGLDLSAMSMRTLSTLHDHAEALSNICYGLAAQPRSLNDDRTPNDAGVVLYRLADDLLQVVSDACMQEARRRSTTTGAERDTRIAMLAREIIENDDGDAIRALNHDLLAMTEA